MIIGKQYHFDAAHFLPDYDGACNRVHGHTWKLEVRYSGVVKEDGMVMDFHILNKIVKLVLDELDHQMLNDILTFKPTCENLIEWIDDNLIAKASTLGWTGYFYLKLQEGEGGWAEI